MVFGFVLVLCFFYCYCDVVYCECVVGCEFDELCGVCECIVQVVCCDLCDDEVDLCLYVLWIVLYGCVE